MLAAIAAVLVLAAPPAAPSATAELSAVVAEVWEFRLREDPLLATAVGDGRFGDRLPSMTRDDLARRDRFWRGALDRLRAIDRAALSPADRINRDMLERELLDAVAETDFGTWRLPWNADSGFHTELAQLPGQVPLSTVRDYENYIARLRAMPAYVRQQIALLREGVRTGFTLPRAVLDGYDVTIRAHVVDDPATSVFCRALPPLPGRRPGGGAGAPARRRPRRDPRGRGRGLSRAARLLLERVPPRRPRHHRRRRPARAAGSTTGTSCAASRPWR